MNPSLPRQFLFVLHSALGQFARHRTVRRVAVELFQHPYGRSHVSRQGIVVHTLLELVRRVGVTKGINRSLLPIPISLHAGFLRDVGEPLLHTVHRPAVEMAKHVLIHVGLAAA